MERGDGLLVRLVGLAACVAALLALSCVARPISPLEGRLQVQIVPEDNGLGARFIEAGKPWNYNVLWFGEIKDDEEVLVGEVINGEVRRTAAFSLNSQIRISSWNKGLVISRDEYLKLAGGGRYRGPLPGERLEETDTPPPLEGHEFAADNPEIKLEIVVFEAVYTGKFNSFGAPEVMAGKLLAKTLRTLQLRCSSCQV